MLRICLAGITGWAGSELAKGICKTSDLTIAAGVSRNAAGKNITDVLNLSDTYDGKVFSCVEEALESANYDIFVEYTSPTIAKHNVLSALKKGLPVVVGTSGLNKEDYNEIDELAQSLGLGVLACGNFSITAILLKEFAQIAARYISHWEIIEYATDSKIDVPSGTVRELATKLEQIKDLRFQTSTEKYIGETSARGATVNGTQIHSVRLPGFTLGVDIVFGAANQTLIISHSSSNSALPVLVKT